MIFFFAAYNFEGYFKAKWKRALAREFTSVDIYKDNSGLLTFQSRLLRHSLFFPNTSQSPSTKERQIKVKLIGSKAFRDWPFLVIFFAKFYEVLKYFYLFK